MLAYHRGPRDFVVDLGCGPGTATRALAAPHRFARALGTDPSAGMIAQAKAKTKTSASQDDARNDSSEGSASNDSAAPTSGAIDFRQAPAESLPFLSASSVDCLTAAQAAHWFDQSKVWAEAARVLRPHGTVAFWGYKDPVFVGHPRASAVLQAWAYDLAPDRLGSYWQQPGRGYVQEKLRVLQPPEDWFGDVERVEYEPNPEGKGRGEGEVLMEKTVSVGQFKEYVRTWSSFHGWKEVHPGREARAKGGEGDAADEMVDAIAAEEEFFRDEENLVHLEWGSAIVLARRK